MVRKMVLGTLLAGALLFGADAKLLKDAKAKTDAKQFDEAVSLLEPAYKANPKDAALSKALADTHFKYGDSLMNNAQLPPFRKYPGALKQFRSVLVYDKENKAAKDNIKMIEDIYKQMGRPVPQ